MGSHGPRLVPTGQMAGLHHPKQEALAAGGPGDGLSQSMRIELVPFNYGVRMLFSSRVLFSVFDEHKEEVSAGC